MALSNVKITVDATQAIKKLRAINDQSKRLGRTFRVLDKRNKGLTTRFNNLGKAIAAIGLVEFGRRSVQTAANFEKLNLRLKLLTAETGDFAKAQAIAARGQKLFGISLVEATDGVTNITSRLLPLGVSLKDIETTFIGFNTAAKLGGASAQEASNAFRQLAQALGSGRLAGDEFRSVSEQVPLILKPLADELGVSVGALKELAAQGKLTSDVVIRALKSIGDTGAKDLKKILENDPTQVFKNLQNEIELFQITVGKALLPATKVTTESLSILIGVINTIPAEITSAVVGITGLVTAFTILKPLVVAVKGSFVALGKTLATLALTLGGPLTALLAGAAVGVAAITKSIIDNNKERKELNDLIEKGTAKSLEERIELEENTLSQLNNANARGNAKRGIERQIKEQKELIRLLKEEASFKKSDEESDFGIDTSFRANRQITIEAAKPKPITSRKDPRLAEQNLVKELKRKIAVKKTENEFDKEILQRKFEHIDNIKEIISNEKIKNKEQAITLENQLFQIDNAEILKRKLEETITPAEQLQEKFKEIGQSVEEGIVSNLTDAVMGTKTLAEAATNVLNNLKRQLVEVAIQRAVSGIGGKIGGFLSRAFGGKKERGGPVQAGGAYLVGERGPEILQLGSKGGNIIPNNAIGGGGTTNNMITVNVDASGTSVQGSGSEADQLGGLIASVVQATIIDEQRAGGLLNR